MHKSVMTAAAVLSLGAASFASADTIFSNRGTGPDGLDVFSSDIIAPVLEDGTFTGVGPYDINAINIGYDNTGNDPVSVDVLVSFFDNVDYLVIPEANPIATNQIGPTYRFNFLAQVAGNETGYLPLTGGPLSFPDSTFGVMVNFVTPNTDTSILGINHLFRDVPINVGTSDDLFGYDFDLSGIIDGTEIFTWDDETFPPGNMFFEVQGTTVPEPGAAMLLGTVVLGTMTRRRRA